MMQTGRVVADVAATGQRRRGAPPSSVSAAARRARRVRHPPRAYPLGPARFVTGMAVIVALATAAFGVKAYVRAGHQETRIAALQGDLARLQQRVAGDEQAAATTRQHVRSIAAQASSAHRAVARFRWALQSVPSEAQVAGVRNEVAAYAACIPQLQSEIAGLGVSWKINPSKPAIDVFKLSTSAPISASCASALAGR
jgi:cytochrome bd-type quinol oxidase subunit 1